MDYLDSKKQVRHQVILFTGYILIAVAITIGATILLKQAYGFGIGKNGAVIQNGLAYFSSHPNPAKIYVNSSLNPRATNTRLFLQGGIYKISLSRAGYYDWQRTIQLDGGSVEHFDYPFLFPKTLTTNKIQVYNGAPGLLTQSPDKRWLVVGKPGSMVDFDVYDLKNPAKSATAIILPDGLLTKAIGAESWQLAEWADDNKHVLLQHNFDGKTEFILVDRTAPEQSLNLNTNLSANPAKVILKNKKFDQYYFYNASDGTLQLATLKSTTKTVVLQHVLAFQPYGNSTILYVTDAAAPPGKVLLRMLVGDKSTTIHNFPTSPNYVVDLTEYNGIMYVAVGASVTSRVFIYKDPLSQLANLPGQAVVPAQVLHVDQPNYLSFSDNAQFIVTENAGHFGVYDLENDKGYNYVATNPLDSPQPHAEWMDGDRLDYISGGKLVIFDYDHTNQHSLGPASSHYLSAFAPDYKYVYSMVQNATGQYELNQTWLLAPLDR